MEPVGARGRRVLAAFAGESVGVRLRMAVRWRTLPVRAVADAVAAVGAADAEVLEIGCGHGLVALDVALDSPARTVRGVDVAAAPVAVAARAAAAAGVADRARFDRVPDDWLPAPASADVVVVVDVLYLLGRDRAFSLLDAAWAAVRPGGALVVKETEPTPRLKAAVVRVQERLSVRVLRLTEGAVVEPVGVGELAAYLERAGVAVTVRRVDRGHLHPHALLVAAREI